MSDAKRAGIAAALAAFAVSVSLAATSVANGHPAELAFSLAVYLLVLATSWLLVRSTVPPQTGQRRLQVVGYSASALLSLGGATWAFGPGSLEHPSWRAFGPYCLLVAIPLLVVGHLLFHSEDETSPDDARPPGVSRHPRVT